MAAGLDVAPRGDAVAALGLLAMAKEEKVTTEAFLEKVYQLSNTDKHAAIDTVMDFMDDCQIAGDFPVCNEAFRLADPAKLEPSVVIAFLMITRRGKPHMPNRSGFITRAIGVCPVEHAEAFRKYE